MTFFVILFAIVSIGGVGYALIMPMMSGEAKVESRLKTIAEGKTQAQTQATGKEEKDAVRRKQISAALDTTRNKKKDKQTLEARIGQAGIAMTRSQYFIFCGLAGLGTGFLVLTASGNPLMGLLGALIGSAGVPHWYLGFRKKKRLDKFSADFPGAIDVIVRGIKAGLPLGDCIKIVGSEAPEPLAAEFRGITESQQIGMTVGEAVERLAVRVPTPEANFFAIVIMIQQKTGGNLSEALGNLSRVLRDRKKMRHKIKAMASEATASAAIIAALPFIVSILVYLTSPDYIMLLFTTSTGNVTLLASGFWMACGIFVIRKMINFDF
jgi:tight adherence protein B